MASTDPALRPLTLPSLPPDLSTLAQLKQQLAQLHTQIEGYTHIQHKLDGFTDQPTYQAYIPFTPLAYFPGKLVHTNDITQTIVADDGEKDKEGKGEKNEPERVLRSAKQAREEAARLQADLENRAAALEKEIAEKERQLKEKREQERIKKEQQGAEAATAAGELGDEDWSVNERGELINEEGLPMFDIREDIPDSEPSSSSASSARKAEDIKSKPKMRYLIKKGGKQVVRPLNPPTSPLSRPPVSAPSTSPAPAPSSPTSAPPTARADDPSTAPTSETGRLSQHEIAALLDELEAEERAEEERQAVEDAAAAEVAAAEEAKKAEEQAKKEEDAKKPAPAFAGFSAGFLAKSKQKRPSNSLVPPPPSSTTPPSSAPAPSAPSPAPPAAASTPAPADKPPKSALSRPSSPAPRSIFDKPQPKKEKKRVVWDASVEGSGDEAKEKRAPIILGMGGAEGKEAAEGEVEEIRTPGVASASAAPSSASNPPAPPAPPSQRPIKDQVVERPLRKPVPPGGGGGIEGEKPKRVSRFRRAKEELVDSASAAVEPAPATATKEDKGKGRAVDFAPRDPSSLPISSSSAPPTSQTEQTPQPVHTISLSSRPTAGSSSTGSTEPKKEGTINYADLDFGPDEEDPDLAPSDLSEGEEEEEEDDYWGPSDDDEDEEFDVDAALHQREVALAYHQQRLRVGAGAGTGALGGFHNLASGEGVWDGVGLGGAGREQEGLVPTSMNLQDLDPSLSSSHFGTYPGAGSAQEGRPSRFRQSTRHLESAQLIIPSLLAADPSLTTSKTPLGPAASGGGAGGADDNFTAEEQARLARTLEALASGQALPEDEQRAEREREVQLRADWAREKADREDKERRRRERERGAGKAPPTVLSASTSGRDQVTPVTFAPRDPSLAPPVPVVEQDAGEEKPPMSQEEELAALLAPPKVEEAQAPVAAEAAEPVEAPKRMSRFRQKQLGLID
ncbi:hypothetical protein JCM8097_001788 [Rhodosporidiobolus ruineniae]